MTSKPRRERRAGWKEATWELYDEGGRAVGKALAYDPSREPEIWAQVRGLGIWERWHLAAFVRWWRIENPQEYNRAKANRHNQRQRKLKQAGRLEATREASIAEAMLTLTRPAKSPAPTDPDPYPNRRQKGWPQRPPTPRGT